MDKSNSVPWPKTPKFIFTSDNFDTDELFKVWAGARADEGTPYILGQHGANYGTSRFCYSETECVAVSDKFVTWGWEDNSDKHCPAFVLTRSGNEKHKHDTLGGLLLVEVHGPATIWPWDEYPDHEIYQQEQFNFVENLPAEIQTALVVRLHGAHKKLAWGDSMRWSDRCPSIVVEGGDAPITTLIAKSRLVVHSYDSTGILETLSQNIPTICYWPGGFNHLRESAIPYYEMLRNVGIFHGTAESAAHAVAAIWTDVSAWWEREDVQHARRLFCERYARTTDNPARSLKTVLLNVSAASASECS